MTARALRHDAGVPTRVLLLVIVATTVLACKRPQGEPDKLPVPSTEPDDASRPVSWPFDAAVGGAIDAASATAPRDAAPAPIDAALAAVDAGAITGTLAVTASVEGEAIDAATRARWLARFGAEYARAFVRCDHFRIPPGDVRLVLDVDAQGRVTRASSPDAVPGLACLTGVAAAFRFDPRAAAGTVTVTLHLTRR